MRASGLAPVRGIAAALAISCGSGVAATGGSAHAEEIGALDSFFHTEEAATLTPAPLAPTGAAVMPPQGAKAGGRPRAELLLDLPGGAEGPTILSEAARRSLRFEATAAALRSGLEDPLARREAEAATRAEPGARLRRLLRARTPERAGPDEAGMVARLFDGVEGPLQDALRGRDDPIRTGALLATARGAALNPAIVIAAALAAEEAPAIVEAPTAETDAVGRRIMLLAVGLAAVLTVAGAVIYSFAPTGGASLRRR
ncbi:hypothetical protein [Albimonas pacifica]|uniref:Uncharacterized protein n=1 Tax=Albimonas pacifica TaxID=1114924 RepID=A0A1I3LW64_9RHOB|nr:hypothetical protein [Albimonas pacifica]SFI89008.1 hypothetical protein SAMN05216258_110204 [Albimonas pacifica]